MTFRRGRKAHLINRNYFDIFVKKTMVVKSVTAVRCALPKWEELTVDLVKTAV